MSNSDTDDVQSTESDARTRLLQGTGAASAIGLAGCLSDIPGVDDDPEEDEAFFEVADLEPAVATIDAGEPIDVSATVENTGDEEGTQDVELRVGDETLDATELTLEAGADETVSFEAIETDDLEPGEYSHGVHSEDDADTGSLTIEGEPDEEFLSWNREIEAEADPDAATDWDNYDVHDLGEEADGELMAIDVDPEGRIWYIGRGAGFVAHGDDDCQVVYVDPDTEEHTLALELDVIVGAEEVADGGDTSLARELGGQSVAICPNFEETGHVYVYYHPSSEEMDMWDNPYNEDIVTMLQRVSRFEMDGDGLDPDSEEVVIEIPLQLNTCCHIGGYLEFGPEGDLWITTGDDSNNVGNPDGEVNWSMTDERDGDVHGRPAAVSDAQRTSGNTADLRGSVLRITPTEDGEDGEMYEVPEGNLKDHWEEETGEDYSDDEFLPEIYAMGLRNPFAVSIDSHTGYLFTGNYGNDAGSVDFNLGMQGQADYHLFCEPGNAGFPYFRGYYPYRDWDFENDQPGQPFWHDNLRNRSPNNTGIENIPNVTPGLIWHPQGFDGYEDAPAWMDMPRPGEVTWPELDAGGSADAGVAYRYSEEFGEGALDPYFEGKQFFMNPSNADVIRYLTFNEDGSLEIDEFLPDNDIGGAYDMDVLPDGRLAIMGMYSGIHVVEYSG
ncbi:PQQ-dependent sugar dehydrogenase [Halobacteria archaeon AArc-dxtr1]|nr:PQQ-dependent sugar dehydrogenase [Halobacteria archaeon AArc-dxtr1]